MNIEEFEDFSKNHKIIKTLREIRKETIESEIQLVSIQ